MIFLLLSILSSTGIALIFKSIEKYSINTFHAIVINYFAAAVAGFLLIKTDLNIFTVYNQPWFMFSILIGTLFIIMFYIIGISTQRAGISVTTVSGRMSLVIPVVFSILYYQEDINWTKIIGIVLALVSVFFTVYKKDKSNIEKKYLYLPLIIFFGAGFIDSLVKYTQNAYLTEDILPVFTTLLFSMSLIIGLIILLFQKTKPNQLFQSKTIFWGCILGLSNFGSIYFFVSALNHSVLSSSVIFGINHISIVAFTVVFALIFFKEKLNPLNWFGIVLSFLAIFILSKFNS